MSTVAGFEPALSRPKIRRHIHSATQYALNLVNCYTNIQYNPTVVGSDFVKETLQKCEKIMMLNNKTKDCDRI